MNKTHIEIDACNLRKIAPPTEREFIASVLEYAAFHGWRAFHSRPAMTRGDRWVTPIQGKGSKGFPDCVLLRGKRLIFAELKADKGKTTTEQDNWIWELERAGQEVYVWRPCDWPLIEHILTAQEMPS